MKYFMSFTLSTVVIAVILSVPQYAPAIIGDYGKPSETAIIDDNDRQFLLQDITKIKEEIKIMQTKLNNAKEGENLTALYGGQSVKNLKELFNSLSTKLNNIQVNKSSAGSIQKLTDGASKGIIIVNGLEGKVGTNNKSASLEELRNLSDVVNKLEAVLQGDQPEYRK